MTSNNPSTISADSRDSNAMEPDIIQQNSQMPTGKRNRQLMSWRVPGIGKVDMYINPQQIVITNNKITKVTRTKGGYIVQYWGDDVTKISLDGTTGASSIEGINILESIYRAEQNAFQQVASTLADRFQEYSGGIGLGNLLGQAAGGSIGNVASTLLGGITGGLSNPPLLPTLGSLATAVEMYYQGWIYKGFFTSFTVTESVTAGIGVFMYKLEFTSFDKRGIRSNFTSWARSPAALDPSTGVVLGYYKADTASTPLSYKGEG